MHKAFRILGKRAVASSIRERQCCQIQANLFVSPPHGDFRQACYRLLSDCLPSKAVVLAMRLCKEVGTACLVLFAFNRYAAASADIRSDLSAALCTTVLRIEL